MQYILTPKGSRELDQHCVQELGITGHELMTTASQNASIVLRSRIKSPSSILIACGGGNNGGDGFAMAHMLADVHKVTVVTSADPASMSSEAQEHYATAAKAVSIIGWEDLDSEYDVVVDALLGSGGSSKLRDPIPEYLSKLNALQGFKVAVDIPSGVDGLTGEVHNDAYNADLTITMEGIKTGCLSVRGREVSGDFEVVSIGAPRQITASFAKAVSLEQREVRAWLPQRDRKTSKFDFGRVLVIAGSRSMRGAAALASEAAMRVGGGLCILATTEVHPLTPREVMTEVLPANPDGTISPSSKQILEYQAQRATSIIVGPGIGTHPETLKMLAELLNYLDPALPVVIDADGLRLIPMLNRDMSHVVLTPHEGEYQHLIRSREHLDPHCVPKDAAVDLGCIIHKKGVPSVTTDGRTDVWTLNGNPGMATAGSGDVLSGIIGGLLAQGLSPLRSASLGSFLHASAGDKAAAKTSEEFMLAGDIITELGSVLNG